MPRRGERFGERNSAVFGRVRCGSPRHGQDRPGKARQGKARLARPLPMRSGAGGARRVAPVLRFGGLRRERNGPRTGQGAGKPREDGEVGVKLHTLKTPDTERRKAATNATPGTSLRCFVDE